MTTIANVRLLISDVDAPQHFTDTQVQAFLDLEGNSVRLAAALALESWAASEASSMQSEKVGDYSYSRKTADNKLALAARYRDNESKTPVTDWAEMELTEDVAN